VAGGLLRSSGAFHELCYNVLECTLMDSDLYAHFTVCVCVCIHSRSNFVCVFNAGLESANVATVNIHRECVYVCVHGVCVKLLADGR